MVGQTSEIAVAAAILLDERNRMLVVRKRGTQAFMQPGGKAEAGETFEDAVRREVAEETGFELAPNALTPHGIFRAPAANEEGMTVVAHVFSAAVVAHPMATAAEIEEHVWIDLDAEPTLTLAALTRCELLPLARSLVAERLL